MDLWAKNWLGLATHLPYSLDPAPSDLFLFGHVKHCLQGMAFASQEEIFTAIGEILTDIPKETLHHVFDHWMERLEWVSQHNGDYYQKPRHWLIQFSGIGIRE
jgi:hypothetical protein